MWAEWFRFEDKSDTNSEDEENKYCMKFSMNKRKTDHVDNKASRVMGKP